MMTDRSLPTTRHGRPLVLEDERRYLILDFDRSILTDRSPKDIRQGYYHPDLSLRVRITDGQEVEYMTKFGRGQQRMEDPYPSADLGLARYFLASLPWQIAKDRYSVDGFDLDLFKDVATGIVFAEYEAKEGRPAFDGTKPSWVHEWIEVTDDLTSRDIAFMVPALRMRDPNAPILDYVLPRRIPRIALTGGPGAGKDGVIEYLIEAFDELKFMQEVATTIARATDSSPAIADPFHNMQFQRRVYEVQHAHEFIATSDAIRKGMKGIVFNRGMVDNAGYLPGGPASYEAISGGRSFKDEYDRYDLVIFLDTPGDAIYTEALAKNDKRSEDHPQALERRDTTRDLWSQHPHVTYVGNYDRFEDKCRAVEAIVRKATGL